VLVEEFVGVLAAKFVAGTFGFGSTKSRTVGVGLCCRLLAFMTLFESF
jgi:hypothetical protein